MNMQIAITKWARLQKNMYPELALFHAIPNGSATTGKNRINLVRSGLLRGMPDLFLPVPRGTFHGFYIELKTKSGKLSHDQVHVIELLRDQNYKVEICRSTIECIEMIKDYLKLPTMV